MNLMTSLTTSNVRATYESRDDPVPSPPSLTCAVPPVAVPRDASSLEGVGLAYTPLVRNGPTCENASYTPLVCNRHNCR